MAAAAMVVVLASPADAHPEPSTDGATHDHSDRDTHQHGDSGGHLEPVDNNVDLVAKLALKNAVPEKIADVGVHNGYAYLAAWGVVTCKYNGVHVVDIRNPAAPREVAFVPSKEGSYPGEGVQALKITTPKFNGDILVTNNEKCKDQAGFGGLNIYDVTNPARPNPLAVGFGDTTANGQGKKDANEIHSVFAWDAGDKAYAVIVDNEEQLDVDIIDITDPKKPVLVAEHDLAARFPQILQDEIPFEVFHHDVIVKEINGRQVMSVSYWDGGYVLLDMTDPLVPVYIADSDFTDPDPLSGELPEGNAHQSELTADNAYLVGADEDFDPFAVGGTNTSDNTRLAVSPGSNTRRLADGAQVSGQARFVGRACLGDPAVPPASAAGQIAVVERGLCTFSEKVASVLAVNASAAVDYEAILLFNRTGADACDEALGMTVEGDIYTFGVAPRSQGLALFNQPFDAAACLADPPGQTQLNLPLGTLGDQVILESYFDGWGYVRLFRNGTGKLAELDTYAVPEAFDQAYASGFGDLSVHEVATSPTVANRLYFSYYSAGFRVVEIQGDQLVEVGAFIDEGGNNLWGVQVFQHAGQEYVAASDRDNGLYIFRYNPAP